MKNYNNLKTIVFQGRSEYSPKKRKLEVPET